MFQVSSVPEPCVTLAWDSEFFGLPIARVCTDRLSADSARDIDTWCRAHEVRCLYAFFRTDCAETTRLARTHGYDLVDVRVTLEREVRPVAVPGWRHALDVDIPALRRIAASAYSDSRFYFDPRFSRPRCDELYATWIESSVHGWADVVATAGGEGEPVGFVTGHLEPPRLGLVGVDAYHRGGGAGRTLVDAVCGWMAERGAERVSVVTQGRNIGAQRFYQRAGFVTAAVALVFHKWFE